MADAVQAGGCACACGGVLHCADQLRRHYDSDVSSRPDLLYKEDAPIRTQSVIWEINAFDQWGVELGKKICSDIYKVINGDDPGEEFGASTLALVELYKANAR